MYDKISKQILGKMWSAVQSPNFPNHSGTELLQVLLSAKNTDNQELTILSNQKRIENKSTLLIEIGNALLSDSDILDNCQAVLKRKTNEPSVEVPKANKVDYSGMRQANNGVDISGKDLFRLVDSPFTFFTAILMSISSSVIASTIVTLLLLSLGVWLLSGEEYFLGGLITTFAIVLSYSLYKNNRDNDD